MLSVLEEFRVKYLIVGGHAVMYYSEPRYTKNIDIFVEVSPENALKVFHALAAFGAPLKGLSEKDFSEPGYFYQMGNPPLRIDVLMSLPGVDFADAWARKVRVPFGAAEVNLISREDLIASKRLSGRHMDLHDVELLERYR
jgi:hypothetical protein